MKIEGHTLIHRLIAALPDDHENLFLVGDPNGPYKALNYPIYPDIIPNKGAPGGVLTALSQSRHPWIYILACDLPYLNRASLLQLQPRTGCQVVLPVSDGQIQYLAGLWSRDALDTIRMLVTSGEPSLGHIVDSLDAHLVSAADTAPYFNLNNHEDWLKIQSEGRAGRTEGSSE